VKNQKGLFDSVVGQIKTEEKRWIIDIDTSDYHAVTEISKFITHLRPEGQKVEAVIPTKNGFHLITKRFDVMQFKNQFPDIDIQKKNPTLLYLPESLS
jgi:phage regulator Rha-like protein